MFTIRNVQLDTLAERASARFADSMVTHIETNYPNRFRELGKRGTRTFVQRVVALGKECHVETQGPLTLLVELMIEFGEGFAHSPDRAWALRMLNHPQLPDEPKLRLIAERLRSRSQGRVIVPVD